MRDDWNERFEKWRKEREAKAHVAAHREHETQQHVAKVEQEIARVEREIVQHHARKKFSRLKLLVLLIPVLIVAYLVYANFLAHQEFTYTYDIGAAETYLTPAERVSAVNVEGATNYRNLTGHLVYFDVPIARGAQQVKVQVRLKDNFPANGRISLGAKNAAEWSYMYKLLYNPGFRFEGFSKKGSVYRINPDVPVFDEEELAITNGVVIAADGFSPVVTHLDNYANEDTTISTSLRGKHVFYIYVKDHLDVRVQKQDINWYEGSDELRIALYDLNGNQLGETNITDDGEMHVNRQFVKVQNGMLRVNNLVEGVYRLEFNDFDGLIREMKLNTNKIVSDKIFLADNELYNVATKQSKLYFTYAHDRSLKLTTYHGEGLQRILMNTNGKTQNYNLRVEDEPVSVNIAAGSTVFTFSRNDIVVEAPQYLAFSEDGYFEPFKQKVVSVNSADISGNNVDYLISDYIAPTQDAGGWKTVETTFDISNDSLYVADNKLSMVFNVPHLAGTGANGAYTIPVDWIQLTVTKGGIFS